MSSLRVPPASYGCAGWFTFGLGRGLGGGAAPPQRVGQSIQARSASASENRSARTAWARAPSVRRAEASRASADTLEWRLRRNWSTTVSIDLPAGLVEVMRKLIH